MRTSIGSQFELRHRDVGVEALTLIELLVALVLIGMAATIVTINLQGSTDKARLRAATLEIEQTLRLARHTAQRHHQPVWLIFEPERSRYRLEFLEPTNAESSAWRALDGLRIQRVAYAATEPALAGSTNPFVVRITPSGVTLPWALELWGRDSRRVVWSDGVSPTLAWVDEIGIADLKWPPSPEIAR